MKTTWWLWYFSFGFNFEVFMTEHSVFVHLEYLWSQAFVLEFKFWTVLPFSFPLFTVVLYCFAGFSLNDFCILLNLRLYSPSFCCLPKYHLLIRFGLNFHALWLMGVMHLGLIWLKLLWLESLVQEAARIHIVSQFFSALLCSSENSSVFDKNFVIAFQVLLFHRFDIIKINLFIFDTINQILIWLNLSVKNI